MDLLHRILLPEDSFLDSGKRLRRRDCCRPSARNGPAPAFVREPLGFGISRRIVELAQHSLGSRGSRRAIRRSIVLEERWVAASSAWECLPIQVPVIGVAGKSPFATVLISLGMQNWRGAENVAL